MKALRRISLAITFLVVAAVSAFAQDDVAASGTPFRTAHAETMASGEKVRDKKFWVISAALTTTMALDTKSTFDVVRNCRDCREANPFVAPFIERGQGVTYTAGILFDAGVMTIAGKMKGSSHTWVRRTWWVAPAALIVGHSIAQRHNVNLLRQETQGR
jgi:hypothetical protein